MQTSLVAERMTYDANGHTIAHAMTVPDYDAVERTVTYEYDNLGNVTRVTAPLE